MAISDKDITIRINVDNTGAIQVLDQTGESIRKVGQNSKESEQDIDSLGLKLGKVVLATAAAKLTFDGLTNTILRGAEVQEVGQTFEKLAGGVGVADEALQRFKVAAGGVITDLDLLKVANKALQAGLTTEQFEKLTKAATDLADVTGQTDVEALEALTRSLAKGNSQLLELVGVYVDAEEANKKFAESIGTTADLLSEEQKTLAFRAEALEEIERKTEDLQGGNETLNGSLDKLKTSLSNLFNNFAAGIAESETLTTRLGELADTIESLAKRASLAGTFVGDFFTELSRGKSLLTGEALASSLFASQQSFKFEVGDVKKSTEALKENAKVTELTAEQKAALKKKQEELAEAAKKAYEEKIKESNQLQDVVSKSEEYKQLLKEIEAGTVSNADATGRLALIYSDKSKLLFEIERKEILLAEALAKVGEGAKLSMEEILVLNKALAENKKELDGTSKSAEKAGSVFGQLLQQFGANADLATGFQFLTSFNFGDGAIGQDLDRLSQVLQSQDLLTAGFKTLGFVLEDLQNFGKSTEETIKGLTSVFLGPINFGLDDFIADVFSSENAGKLARDKVDKYFEDLLDANQVSLVIDGQLQKIKDLAENDIAGLFEDLDKTTPEGSFLAGAFGNIGTALEEQFGVAEDISGQIGAILFNNVGGSLNNLQILFQELGIAQEDLAQAIEEAWLDGDVSAQQFLATTSQINNLYQKGIPDGVGRTDLAFLNLIESAGAGRQVLDALGDLAVEAQENTAGNIKTLDDLKASLLASGADAEKVNQAFTAIANAGITSLDQLANVSVSTAATISAELESVGGFFTEIGDDIASIKQQMDEIRDKEVNIKFNVTTNVDENTQKYVGTSNLPIGEGVQ